MAQKLNKLICSIRDRLPRKINNNWKNIHIHYEFVFDGAYAVTERMNHMFFVIRFNLNKCKEISDMANKGIIAHEFAHIIDYRKLGGLMYFLRKNKIIEGCREEKIDKIARRMGFEREIKQKNSET